MLSYSEFKLVREHLGLPDCRQRHVPFIFCQRDVQPRVSHSFPKQVKVDRSAASFRDVEPVSCEFEPSLLDQNMDIENSRPETDARNQPDGARNRDKIALGDQPAIANPRECRTNFCELDLTHRDWTGW